MSNGPEKKRRWRWFIMPIVAMFFIILTTAVSHAFNLPEEAPILISEKDSTRAVAARPTKRGLDASVRVFQPGAKTRITLFLTNLDLMDGEGANAFRADMEDSLHRRYPLNVVSLDRTEREWVYALTVQLHGGIGDVGDVLTRVTWRGMSSNQVRVAIGHEGDGLKDDEGSSPTPLPEKPIVRKETDSLTEPVGDRIRFMEQATFGPNQATELRLRQLGIRRWIDEQMSTKYESNGRTVRYSTYPYPKSLPLATTPPANCAVNTVCFRDSYSMYPLQRWFFREALYGEDQQLRRRVSWALSQIWVVSGRDIVQSGRMLPYLQILDKNAFGNYRQLMSEMTLNPAMGQYLDMKISTRQNPNENYAREILQLFTVGVDMLNQDGTPILDQNGNHIASYDQNTINNFTKIFTGWDLCNNGANPACQNAQSGIPNYIDPMIVNDVNHDTSQKTLLRGQVIPAGQSPNDDLNQALDNIFYHPNVGPFVSKLLIQQLVTSNPTPAYVGRVAAAFNSNEQGERGDLKAVIRAILLDPEARGSRKTDPDYGKLREPVLFVTNVLRPFNPQAQANAIAAENCNNQSDGMINGATSILDQDVFNPPTVFNYYQLDGLIPSTNLSGPEFGIFSTGTALKRPNFVNQMVAPQLTTQTGITVVNSATTTNHTPCGTRINLDRFLSASQADSSGAALIDQLDSEMLHGTMSPNVKNELMSAIQAVAQTDNAKRVRTAIYLVATSSQFQVQR